DDRRDAVNRSLLEQVDAEAGLAAAGHPDAHRVRHEIGGVVEQVAWLGRLLLCVDRAAKVEEPELFVVHRFVPGRPEGLPPRHVPRNLRAWRHWTSVEAGLQPRSVSVNL